MRNEAAITVRIPLDLKRRLVTRARRARRSLPSQIAADLKRCVESEPTVPAVRPHLLGLYEGGPVPSARDFMEVRRQLWGSLGGQRTRRGTSVRP